MSRGGAAPIDAHIDGIGVIGPGLNHWPEVASVLAGHGDFRSARTCIEAPLALPATERRRVGRVVKVALSAGMEALHDCRVDVRDIATVFTSSGADGENCHAICSALASSQREISPTRFHNSVHNVAAGYWGIATRAMAPSTALCAYDASFAAGLLETVVQARHAHAPVLLIAYDADYPSPLNEKRPIADAFAVGLLIAPCASAHSVARIELRQSKLDASRMLDPGLEHLRVSIPAARSLPLLELLARRVRGACSIAYLPPQTVLVQVEPCN